MTKRPADELQRSWRALQAVRSAGNPPECDYIVGRGVAGAFAGLSRSGTPALLLPLEGRVPRVVRSAAGCVLRAAERVDFQVDGRRWVEPAAALECAEPDLLETFAVLAADIAVRSVPAPGRRVRWAYLTELVEQWQALLAAPRVLEVEAEIGLWGELWFILAGTDPRLLVDAWLGPEGTPVDFMRYDRAVEVKASRARLSHHVSQAQVQRPVGAVRAYLLSLWVGIDPTLGMTLAAQVAALRRIVLDSAELLRRLLQAGYHPKHEAAYTRRYILLEPARWFDVLAVPCVRQADPGISGLRYVVHLDESRCLAPDGRDRPWQSFDHPPPESDGSAAARPI
jgi:hypothetical protein